VGLSARVDVIVFMCGDRMALAHYLPRVRSSKLSGDARPSFGI
jgi:hypothetical protein